MILRLSTLPNTLRGPADKVYNGHVPKRALFLHPEAAVSILEIEKNTSGMVYTDIFRSASASLEAHATKAGTQPPGYSAHGFGLAFDIDVGATLRRIGGTYATLRDVLEGYGWYCHRRDLDSNASEGWHFNYLGDEGEHLIKLANATEHSTWAKPIETKMEQLYGSEFLLSPEEIQEAITSLGLHSVKEFQEKWGLGPDGVAGPKTQRTLAFVTAKISIG